MENMMLQTINFHYSIISHFREQYLKLFPRIENLHESDYPAMFNYMHTVYIPEFSSNVTCTIQTSYYNASVKFQSPRLHKGTAEQLVHFSIHDDPNYIYLCSIFNGRDLHIIPKSYKPLHLSNTPNEIINIIDNNKDELEVMEFMLMTKYNMMDLTAILLHQVLINEDNNIQKYIFDLAPFVGLSTEREQALTDLYFSTAIGLEHEAAKVG